MQEIDSLARETRGTLGYADDGVAGASGAPLRYELFHSAKSICSQKVRAVLAHHEIPYLDREMDVMKGDNFTPSYVHLRLLGCERIGAPLAKSHKGSTSVKSAGCDPCVVPTLIDWEQNAVLVDSKRICLELDETVAEENKLMPKALADDISRELEHVDDLPNVQMLLAKAPGGVDTNVAKLGLNSGIYTGSRIEFCRRFMEKSADDPRLMEAYSAKIDKESCAASELFSDQAVEIAYDVAENACGELEKKLAKRGSAWLFGDKVTMADVFWGIELLRFRNLGTASFWDDGRLPHVAHYVSAVSALPSIRKATMGDALF